MATTLDGGEEDGLTDRAEGLGAGELTSPDLIDVEPVGVLP